MKNQLNKECTHTTSVKEEQQEPALFRVVIHNDDFTPMDFVMGILEKFFYMDRRSAADIMMQAHVKGLADCGEYSKDFAEAKVLQVIDYARIHEHPLMCSMEAA